VSDDNVNDGVTNDNRTTDDISNPAPEPLRLDHFLKRFADTGTGGQAKVLIQEGLVKLNGEVETRRRKKLAVGDVVEIEGRRITVEQAHFGD
jgi:ribosome-associated protein